MHGPALQQLRERIREIEGGPVVQRQRIPVGEPLDALLGGLPRPGIVEIHGPLGSGRARVVCGILARFTSDREPVAWVDPRSRLYPPAVSALGVDLDQMLIVRPPEDGSSPWGWATEQLLRSGCFGCVVVDLPRPEAGQFRRSLVYTWARSAELGGCTAVVVSRRPTRELPADVRLSVGGDRVYVVRDRGGIAGRSAPLPPWSRDGSPWP